MTLGQKLKELRTLKGLTQKELADKLHVSFQTVSKWENGENEPDIATLKELASMFNCSVDYLIGQDEPHNESSSSSEEPNKTVIIYKNEPHVCAKCGKDIPIDDLVSEDVTKRERHGRTTRSVTIGQTFYHKACLEEVKAERARVARAAKVAAASKAKRRSFGWGIAGGVLALVIVLVSCLTHPESVSPGLAVLYSILSGYGIFAMLYCILSGSYIGEVFVWCAGLSIKFPGIIFTWDLDGFAFLIVMKIFFAILGFIVGVLAILFEIGFSELLWMVSFPFVLIHNIHTEYEDSLV